MSETNRTWVKICGNRTMKAAVAAVEAGADAVGFIMAPARRQVSPERAEAMIAGLPPGVDRVGVFVDASPEEMSQVAAIAGFTILQLHGNEPPAAIERLSLPVIKAFRVREPADLARLPEYRAAAAILLDPYVEGQYGGTGQTMDWGLVGAAAAVLREAGVPLAEPGEPLTPGRPRLILAGGLTPANVAEAIRKASPGGVDVSSGVESDGEKDIDKIYEFLANARGALK